MNPISHYSARPAKRRAPGWRCVAALAMLALTAAAPAAPSGTLDASLEGLRAADMRLATVTYRLTKANDALCLKHGPLTGLVLHASSDYDAGVRDAVIAHFHLTTPLGVEGVVPGSPAAAADVKADDSIAAIDGTPVAAGESRDDALAVIDAHGPTEPLTLALRRDGRPLTVTLNPVQGCLAHAEVDVSDGLNAATDGKTIEVDSGLLNLIGDDQGALAAIIGHELSHIVLDHPDRLTAAHVDRGLLKGFGRNARLIKRTENEADRLSVTLMANAGYDPQDAVRYWRTYGPKLNDGGGFGSTHPSWQDRADRIAAAVAAIPKDASRPIIPAWIASRNEPLS